MHDIRNLDERGVAGVMIATTAFEQAARAQAEVLSFEPAAVFVPHPIQNRTDEEIRAIADAAVDEIVGAISVGG